jgi:hypothetical protein
MRKIAPAITGRNHPKEFVKSWIHSNIFLNILLYLQPIEVYILNQSVKSKLITGIHQARENAIFNNL